MTIKNIFAKRKQSLGQGNVFIGVCLSMGVGFPACITRHITSIQGDLPPGGLHLGGLHPEGAMPPGGVCISGGLHPGAGSLPSRVAGQILPQRN